MFALEVAAYGTPGGIQCGVIERRSPGDPADAVGSEKFFGHEREIFLPRVAAAEGLQRGLRPEDNLKSLTQAEGCFDDATRKTNVRKKPAETIEYPSSIPFAGMCYLVRREPSCPLRKPHHPPC